MCLETSWRWPRLVTVSLALCRDCGCDYGYSYGCGYFAHECGLIDDLSRPSTLFPWIEYRTSGCRGGLSSIVCDAVDSSTAFSARCVSVCPQHFCQSFESL